MKSRKRQRDRRRVKHIAQRKPWLNSEGYHDPTAYNAIRNAAKLAPCAGGQTIRKPALLTI